MDATNFPEEDTDGGPTDITYNNSEESHEYDKFPQDIQNHTTEQNQITSGYSIDPEEIPESEKDWDNGQFADTDTNLITRHNTHSESERIRREYTQHLLDLSDIQYYDEENPINQLQYSSPDPDVQCWYTCGRGKQALLHGHRLFSENTHSVESRKARKRRQNYRQSMRES